MDDDRLPYSYPKDLSSSELLFAVALRSNGLKLTRTQRVIFNELYRYNEVSIAQLASAAATHGVHKTSTYRAIKKLVAANIVTKVGVSDAMTLQLNKLLGGKTISFTACAACGQSRPFTNPAITKTLQQLAKQWGYSRTSYQVTVTGICRNCRQG